MKSLKKHLVLSLAALPSIEGWEQNQIIIFTSSGRITGTPVIPEKSNGQTQYLTNLVAEFSKQYREENSLPPDSPLDNNDGAIVLSNVTVSNGGPEVHLNFLVVFYDQIVAITIGNLE